jgi:hypothetical protein
MDPDLNSSRALALGVRREVKRHAAFRCESGDRTLGLDQSVNRLRRLEFGWDDELDIEWRMIVVTASESGVALRFPPQSKVQAMRSCR